MAKLYLPYQQERGFSEPFMLTKDAIEDWVPTKAYGVYLLIKQKADDSLVVSYVGRGIIKARLLVHLNTKDAEGFAFKVLEADDDVGFSEECRLFHKYGKRPRLDNRQHPDVPDDAPDDYPKCSQRGCKGEPD
ncbi:MAG: hypothetical protein OK454_01995 [Thaumarchaeota archaeon]|nr:hypothetical protein [Nitrososphaerota archaeon]